MPVNEELLYRCLGKALKSRREKLGLTQGQLADEAKVLRTSVTNIEAGRQRPPLHLLYELCQALGTEVAVVLPSYSEVAQAGTVQVKDIVRSKVGGGVKEVPPMTADFLQQLLKE